MPKRKNRLQVAKEHNLDPKNFWVVFTPEAMKNTEFKTAFEKLSKQNGITVLQAGDLDEHADLVVIPTNDKILQQLEPYKQQDLIPLLPTEQKLTDVFTQFDAINEEGCAFYYEQEDAWNIFASVVRAHEAFKFPYDWSCTVKRLRKA